MFNKLKFWVVIFIYTMCSVTIAIANDKYNTKYQMIILAAGDGTRMKSDLPKVLHKVINDSMLDMVLSTASYITNDIILVYSPQLEKYLSIYKAKYPNLKFVLQDMSIHGQGTGAAVKSALKFIDHKKIVAVLYADNPLMTSDIILNLLNKLQTEKSILAILGFKYNKENKYGRIINDHGRVKIVEWIDANEEERRITLCNSGVMAFNQGVLKKYIPMIQNNNKKGELYLTDIVKICADHGHKISYLCYPNHEELVGVNTQEELEIARDIMHTRLKLDNKL